MRRALVAALLASIAVVPALVPSISSAASYAPLNRPGPALSVSKAKLAAAVTRSGNFHANTLEPVLFNPATGVTAKENFSWNYEEAFTAQHRPWCAVTAPNHTLGDIQIAAEYIVYGIRHTHALAGRKIAILGHSQGGMSMRWALRFWPDTRPMVDDVIGMAPDNHGTTLLDGVCVAGVTTCTAQGWQQRSQARSHFIQALNSGAETFEHISYTNIYSHFDEVVLPANGTHLASALSTGEGSIANIATQSVCPLDIYEHLLIGTIDPAAYALVMDALGNHGPAKASRISKAVCRQLYMPGLNPVDVRSNVALISGLPYVLLVPVPDVKLAGLPQLKSEPPLRCYVFAAGCG